MWDAIVVGGGFYGAVIATYLAESRGLDRVLLVEREARLLARASYRNQARVHSGYHYPRSFVTAYRSRVNLPRFLADFPGATGHPLVKLYAIARGGSQVTAQQFARFCRAIAAPLEPAPPAYRALLDPRLIEAVFLAEERVFDALALAAWAERRLAQAQVEVRLQTQAEAVDRRDGGGLVLRCRGRDGCADALAARCLFNCTYSGLNGLGGGFPGTRTRLKHEIAEMALIEVPETLSGLGITVMDGPFFSLLPFPPRALYTLSHVRYTPHTAWLDTPEIDPYGKLADYPQESRAERMIRDAARYLPALREARHIDSLFEIKTVLVKNEGDDGRPILYERHPELGACWSVLGSKIDNVYDILERLDREPLPGERANGPTAHLEVATHG